MQQYTLLQCYALCACIYVAAMYLYIAAYMSLGVQWYTYTTDELIESNITISIAMSIFVFSL